MKRRFEARRARAKGSEEKEEKEEKGGKGGDDTKEAGKAGEGGHGAKEPGKKEGKEKRLIGLTDRQRVVLADREARKKQVWRVDAS